jgi:hypothetical protein
MYNNKVLTNNTNNNRGRAAWVRGFSPHSPDDAIICSVDAAIQLT